VLLVFRQDFALEIRLLDPTIADFKFLTSVAIHCAATLKARTTAEHAGTNSAEHADAILALGGVLRKLKLYPEVGQTLPPRCRTLIADQSASNTKA
jgi:hypothetical protein